MKESRFNLFFKDIKNSKFVLFNSKTTALAVINDEEFEAYKELVCNNFSYDKKKMRNL